MLSGSKVASFSHPGGGFPRFWASAGASLSPFPALKPPRRLQPSRLFPFSKSGGRCHPGIPLRFAIRSFFSAFPPVSAAPAGKPAPASSPVFRRWPAGYGCSGSAGQSMPCPAAPALPAPAAGPGGRLCSPPAATQAGRSVRRRPPRRSGSGTAAAGTPPGPPPLPRAIPPADRPGSPTLGSRPSLVRNVSRSRVAFMDNSLRERLTLTVPPSRKSRRISPE